MSGYLENSNLMDAQTDGQKTVFHWDTHVYRGRTNEGPANL